MDSAIKFVSGLDFKPVGDDLDDPTKTMLIAESIVDVDVPESEPITYLDPVTFAPHKLSGLMKLRFGLLRLWNNQGYKIVVTLP